jgi:dTDP-glucose 4,6-dehydratase
VSDLVDGLYRLMLSDEVMPVNLGNPREMTILEFATTIIQLTGSKSSLIRQALPEDDPKKRRPDIARARRCCTGSRKCRSKKGCAQPLILPKDHDGSIRNKTAIRNLIYRKSGVSHHVWT